MCYPEPSRTRIIFESWTRTRAELRHAKNLIPELDTDLSIDNWTRTCPERHRLDQQIPQGYQVNKQVVKLCLTLAAFSFIPDFDAYPYLGLGGMTVNSVTVK